MAEMKKYMDTVALGALVDKIKSEDANVLSTAKTYADGLGVNYDAVGTAATKVKELAEGAVATNTAGVAENKAAIEKLNGDASTEGSVAKAVADAKALIDTDVDAVEKKADDNATAIAAINHAENGILAQAKAHAEAEDAKVQGEVDDLKTYVGTIPEGATASDIVGYVQEKTTGIATEGAMTELGNRVTQAEKDIDAIEADYLKAADKTELAGDIADVQTAVDTEKSRAEGIEAGLRTDINTVMGDYLKKADKEELQGNIDTVAGAVERLTNGVSAEEIDGVNDLIQYVKDHGTEVTGMQDGISKNAEDIAAEVERAKGEEAKNAKAASDALTVAQNAQVAADAEAERAAGVEGGLDTRLKAVEAAVGESGSVADDIATAKQEAIDAAAVDATSKAGQALTDAKAHTDAEVAKDRTRLDALEAIDHEHANKALLDTYTQTEENLADAVAKKHEHANAAELAKIADGDVAKWNAAEGNAKTYADGLNTAMGTRVDGVASRVTELEEDAKTHALSSDLTDAVGRIAKNEGDIASLTSSLNSFTAITADEVNALFA